MLMGGKFKQVDSGEFQGAVSRPRAIMTNITDFDQSPQLEGLHMAPSILLKDGYQSILRIIVQVAHLCLHSKISDLILSTIQL